MNFHGKHSERGATMLASLCFATVAAISLSSYVAVSYNAMKVTAAQEQAITEKLAATNTMELTLDAVSSDDFSSWTIEGDTATKVVTDITLADVSASVPVDFTETINIIPAPAKTAAPVIDRREELIQRINDRLRRDNRYGFFSFSAPAPTPEPEPVVEEPAPVINPDEVTMRLTGIGTASRERTLTLTQRMPQSDGSIRETVLTAPIKALTPIHNAIVAQNNIRIRRDGVIDSYDSALGDYRADNAGYDATLASRSIVVSRAAVHGFASASGRSDPTFGRRARLRGPETTEQTAIDSSRIVAYPYQPALDTVVASGAGSLLADAGSTLGTAGSTSARIYYANDVNLSGDQQLTVAGPTILVVDGDLSIRDRARIVIQSDSSLEIQVNGEVHIAGHGIDNNSRRPARLAIIGTHDQTTDFLFASSTPLHAAIYTPLAILQTEGNGREIFGAIVAHRVIFNGDTDFHFDLDLKRAHFSGIETAFVFGPEV